MIFLMTLCRMPGIVNSLKTLGIISETHVKDAIGNVNVWADVLLEER